MIAGDQATAVKLFDGVPESTLVFDDRYVGVLVALKQYDRLIYIIKKRVESAPNNLQYRINLAAAYLAAERRNDAVQAIADAIKIDPSFKEKGDYYISEIRAGRNP